MNKNMQFFSECISAHHKKPRSGGVNKTKRMVLSPTFLDVNHLHGDTLSYFSSVTLPELLEIMTHMRVSSSHWDVIPCVFI